MTAGFTAALAALAVEPDAGYTWLGEPFAIPPHIRSLGTPEVRRSALVQGISRRLYGDFFSVGRPRRAVRGSARRGPARRLADDLAAANSGTGCVDHGWTVAARDADLLVVERSGLRLWVDPAEVCSARPPDRIPVGGIVSVRIGKDAPGFSPGYYMVLGDRGFDLPRPPVLDRFYLNVRERWAVECVQQATGRLNALGLPFRLKVANDPDNFDRCDTAILTFERKHRDLAVSEVLRLHRALAPNLGRETPPLARRLAAGLAFAEDPGDGRSFGAHRCTVVAEAAVRAAERRVTDLDGRLAIVAACLREVGSSLDRPYLGRDSPGDLSASGSDVDEECVPCL